MMATAPAPFRSAGLTQAMLGFWRRLFAAAAASLLAAAGSAHAAGPALLSETRKKVPPSWEATTPSGTTSDQGDILGPGERLRPGPPRRSEGEVKTSWPRRPWYLPRVSLGVGANLPEILQAEVHTLFGRYVGLRFFYAPALPLKVKVQMPSELIDVKENVGIANPAYTIDGKVTYGDHYGVEGLVFPWGGSFFLMGGVSHRKIRLVADAQSPLLICSGSQILQDAPCSDPRDSIQTQIQLGAHADVKTSATLLRTAIGWYWHVSTYGYLNFTLGAAKPVAIHREADLAAEIITPAGANAELNTALQQMRESKLEDLRQQTLQATKPVDQQLLPIFGISAGIRF